MFYLNRILPLLFISIGLGSMVMASPESSNKTHDNDIELLIGFESSEGIDPADSIIDLSDISTYGEKIEWKYLRPDNTNLVEHRGDSWIVFSAAGDSLFLTHAESSREQRNFIIETGKRPGAHSHQTYSSETRRDMSFLYVDSGCAELRKFITPLLILSPGDSIRNCHAELLTIDFLRRKAPALKPDSIVYDPEISIDSTLFLPGEPLAHIKETEIRWFAGNTRIPLAIVDMTTTMKEMGDTTLTCRSYSFPSDLNPAREEIAVQSNTDIKKDTEDKDSDPRNYNNHQIGLPEITITDNRLSVTGISSFHLTLCDVSGKVIIPTTLMKNNETLDLSGYTAGEYVINISDTDNNIILSRTIILR